MVRTASECEQRLVSKLIMLLLKVTHPVFITKVWPFLQSTTLNWSIICLYWRPPKRIPLPSSLHHMSIGNARSKQTEQHTDGSLLGANGDGSQTFESW